MTALPSSSLQDLEFEFVQQPGPSLLSRKRKHRRAAAPFASVTMQQSPPSKGKAPAFTIASAVESRPGNLEGVPQWRITAGNLAAGATAGCSVEAGGFASSSDIPGERSGAGLGLLHTVNQTKQCSTGLPLLCSTLSNRHHQDAAASYDQRRRHDRTASSWGWQGPVCWCLWQPGRRGACLCYLHGRV